MAPAAAVEALDVVEDRAALVCDAACPSRCRIEQSCLHTGAAERSVDRRCHSGSPTVRREGSEPGPAGPLGEGPGSELGAVVTVNDAPGRGGAGVDGHAQRWSPGPPAERSRSAQPTTRRDQASQDDAAVHLALPGRVLGAAVIHSWLAPCGGSHRRTRSVTVASFLDRMPTRGAGTASPSGTAHEQADGVVPDGDAVPVDQLGVHPGSTVGAAGGRWMVPIRSVSQACGSPAATAPGGTRRNTPRP